jgi:S1-C subfamily serine protease
LLRVAGTGVWAAASNGAVPLAFAVRIAMKNTLLVLALAGLASGFPVVAHAYDPEESTTIAVYEQASKAVVSIRSYGGSGAGALIDGRGLVVTNNHVVQGTDRVQVKTADGRTYIGQVLALDGRNDLALVQIRPEGRLPSLRLSQKPPRVGQRVYAIGNPFGLDRTLTVGILSRIAPNGDLQTDAALNPGNSGGPLLNSDGEIIGINKAILSPGRGGNIGIGFATSTAPVRQILAAADGSARRVAARPPRQTRRGLGVVLDAQTLTVLEVQPGSPAERSGLRPGDTILGVNNYSIRSTADLQQVLQQSPRSLVLTVERDMQVGRVRIEL